MWFMADRAVLLLAALALSAHPLSAGLKFAPVKVGDESLQVEGIMLVGFTKNDLVAVNSGQTIPEELSVLAGRLESRSVVPAGEAISGSFRDKTLILKAERQRSGPLVILIDLPYPSAPLDMRGGEHQRGAPLLVTTDGAPASVQLHPVFSSVVLHDDQLSPSPNWYELIADQLDFKPTQHPVDLGGGRFRVPGKAAFAAALTRVNPKLPESVDLAEIEDRLVLMKVLISKDGRIASAQAVRGDPRLGAAVEEALREWTFDTAKLAPQAELIETVLPFEFRKKK